MEITTRHNADPPPPPGWSFPEFKELPVPMRRQNGDHTQQGTIMVSPFFRESSLAGP